MLTDLVTEVLEDSSCDTLVAHGIAEKLRHQLNSKAFSLGIEHHRSGHKVREDVYCTTVEVDVLCIQSNTCMNAPGSLNKNYN